MSRGARQTMKILVGAAALMGCSPCGLSLGWGDSCTEALRVGCEFDSLEQGTVIVQSPADLVTCDHARSVWSLELEGGSDDDYVNLDSGFPRLRSVEYLTVTWPWLERIDILRDVSMGKIVIESSAVPSIDALGPPSSFSALCVTDQDFDWSRLGRYSDVAYVSHTCREASCAATGSFAGLFDSEVSLCGFAFRGVQGVDAIPPISEEACDRELESGWGPGESCPSDRRRGFRIADTEIENVDVFVGVRSNGREIYLGRNPSLTSLQGLSDWGVSQYGEPATFVYHNPKITTAEIESLGFPIAHCGNFDDDPCVSDVGTDDYWQSW